MSTSMIAFSLSGGGSRGPIQVGALRALFEAGIEPQILVGTSAGAVNAAFLATNPTAAGVEHLAQIWRETTAKDIFPNGRFSQIVRFIAGMDGLNNSDAVRRYALKYVPPGIETFGDLKIKLYLTTANLQTGRLFLFGDDPTAKVVDAVLSSTALPVAWEPQVFDGQQFVDGGVVANVPISIAFDRGADTIYALDLQSPGPYPVVHGVLPIALHSITVQTYQQVLRDIQRVINTGKVTLHYINFGDILPEVPLEDFTHAEEMLAEGYQRAKEYLANPKPNKLPRPIFDSGSEVTPPGAVPYKPRF